jgi:tetratricopeptide (TPR) repeat protein
MYSPSDAGAYNNVARTYALKGDFPQALIAEDYSLQRHASDPESYMIRGMIFLHFGKTHDAEEDFRYGESIGRGTLASYAGQIENMRRQPALPYRPKLAGKTLNDAALQEMRENDRQAVDILDPLIAQEPRNAGAWLLRGEAHYNLKQFALSREDIQQALRICKSSPSCKPPCKPWSTISRAFRRRTRISSR